MSPEKYIEKNEKKCTNPRDLWDNIKHSIICIIRIPEGEDRTWGIIRSGNN